MANIQFETVNTAANRKKRGSTPQILLLFLVCCAIFGVLAFAFSGKKTAPAQTPPNDGKEKVPAAPAKPAPAAAAPKPASKPAPKPVAKPKHNAEAKPVVKPVADAAPPVKHRAPAAVADKAHLPPDMTQELPRRDEQVAAQAAALFEKADAANVTKIRDELRALVARYPLHSPQWRAAAEALGMLNMRIFHGFGLVPDKVVFHEVAPGDALSKLARRYHTSIEAIQHANRIPAASSVIRLGRKLRIYNGDWSVQVYKKAHLLCVYDGGQLFKVYDIGIGRQGRTPAGTFVITDKIKDPDWYAPDGRMIRFGEKENVLGTRWFKLEPEGSTDHRLAGYGIHGTSDDTSITRSQSNGCVRMRNPDVEELYTVLPRQVKVLIQD